MNSQKLLLFLSIGLISLISSCKKEADEPGKTNVIMPIKTGNSWTYKATTYQSNQTTIDTVLMSIGEKVNIKGVTGYLFNQGEAPKHANFIGINDSEGNLISVGGISDVDTLIAPSVVFKINVKAGEEWNYTAVSSLYDKGTFEQNTLTLKCISIDTLVTTPLGIFKCKLFEEKRNSGDDTFRNFYADNIGMIRSEHYEYTKLFSAMELIIYELK